MRQQYRGQLEDLKEKVAVYESMMHSIQTSAVVTMDAPVISHIIDIICSWSYAHRVGNGEHSDKMQETIVRKQFERLKSEEWKDSNWNSGKDTVYKERAKQHA